MPRSGDFARLVTILTGSFRGTKGVNNEALFLYKLRALTQGFAGRSEVGTAKLAPLSDRRWWHADAVSKAVCAFDS